MKVSILSSLKGLFLAAVVLVVPAFAACGLLASRDSSVELASEHDPLRNMSRVVEVDTILARTENIGQRPTPTQVDGTNFVYTIIVPPKSPAK